MITHATYASHRMPPPRQIMNNGSTIHMDATCRMHARTEKPKTTQYRMGSGRMKMTGRLVTTELNKLKLSLIYA